MAESVIVYKSPMEQQTAEMVAYAYQSGDMVWFWGVILAALILIAVIAEYKTKNRR